MRKAKTNKRASAVKSKRPPRDVDEYLAAVPEPARSTLNRERAAIRAEVPAETTEIISYGIPAFKYNRVLVWLAAFKDHCSLFPTAEVIRMFQEELKGYSVSKGTIHFATDKPLPAALVRRMVRARVANNERRKR